MGETYGRLWFCQMGSFYTLPVESLVMSIQLPKLNSLFIPRRILTITQRPMLPLAMTLWSTGSCSRR